MNTHEAEDMDKNRERKVLLQELIQGERPVARIISELAQFGWDSSIELATLTSRDLTNMLTRFINGALSSQQVVEWANAIECREDVGFEPQEEVIVKQAVHELATPELWEPITIKLAQAWIERLKT